MSNRIILIIAILLVSLATVTSAQVTLQFGDKSDQVAFINQNNHPGIEEPLPLGPLTFRATAHNFYIADSVGGKIIITDKQKGFIAAVKLTEKPAEILIDDMAVVIGKDGKATAFWVVDAMTNSLIKFDCEGKQLTKIASEKLIQPYRLEISNSGLLFIADKGARAIFAFNQEGALMAEMPWEWSGMALSADADILYRLGFAHESNSSFLTSANLEGTITMERELNLGNHFNPELWWVDEEKQECVITYATEDQYQTDLIIARVGFDGEIKAKDTFKAPFAMNRFLDRQSNEIWAGSADYNEAPKGSFNLLELALP